MIHSRETRDSMKRRANLTGGDAAPLPNLFFLFFRRLLCRQRKGIPAIQFPRHLFSDKGAGNT